MIRVSRITVIPVNMKNKNYLFVVPTGDTCPLPYVTYNTKWVFLQFFYFNTI